MCQRFPSPDLLMSFCKISHHQYCDGLFAPLLAAHLYITVLHWWCAENGWSEIQEYLQPYTCPCPCPHKDDHVQKCLWVVVAKDALSPQYFLFVFCQWLCLLCLGAYTPRLKVLHFCVQGSSKFCKILIFKNVKGGMTTHF